MRSGRSRVLAGAALVLLGAVALWVLAPWSRDAGLDAEAPPRALDLPAAAEPGRGVVPAPQRDVDVTALAAPEPASAAPERSAPRAASLPNDRAQFEVVVQVHSIHGDELADVELAQVFLGSRLDEPARETPLGRTGPRGRLALPLGALVLFNQDHVVLSARHPEFLTACVLGRAGSGTVEVLMTPREPVDVLVLHAESGEPVADARVSTHSPVFGSRDLAPLVAAGNALRIEDTRTSPLGEAWVAALADPPVDLRVAAEGFVTHRERLPRAPQRAPHVVELEPGRTVVVRVLDELGEPLAGASLAVGHEGAGGLEQVPRRSADDGRVTLRDVPRTSARLSVDARHPDFDHADPSAVALPPYAPGESPPEVDVLLTRGARLEYDVRGWSPEHGPLTLSVWTPGPWTGRRVVWRMPLALDATTLVESLPAGVPLRVTCRSEVGVLRVDEELVLEPGELRRIECAPPEHGAVVVTVEGDVAHKAHGRVRLTTLDGVLQRVPGTANAMSEQPLGYHAACHGIARLPVLPGNYALHYESALGYVDELTLSVAAGETRHVRVSAVHLALLEGRLVDQRGAPLPDQPLLFTVGAARMRTRSDDAGRFRFTELPAAPGALFWISPMGSPVRLAQLTPGEAPVTDHALTVCRVTGRVIAADDAPGELPSVLLVSHVSGPHRPDGFMNTLVDPEDLALGIDAQGRFDLLLPEGEWDLYAMLRHASFARERVIVGGSGCPAPLELRLLHHRVELMAWRPAKGDEAPLELTLRSDGDPGWRPPGVLELARGGKLQIPVPPGTLHYTATRGGALVQEGRLEVGPRGIATLQLP